jgi:outer membrane immunogenic protein
MPVKAAPLPGCIWSGLYVGAHVGVGQPTFKGTWFGGSFTQDFKQQPSGILGGAQVGQNWCSNTFVYGWEADASFMNWKKTSEFSEAGPPPDSVTNKLSLLSSLRVKLGIPTLDPKTMFFVSIGPAYARGKATMFDNDFLTSTTTSFNKFGGVAGLGIEQMLTNNLSWRLEGLYYIFDTQKTLGGPFGVNDFATDKLKDVLVIRLGLNYKLGDPWGKGPVATAMPVKAPHYGPAAFDWSGIYIGGEAGWQGSRIRLDDPTVASSLVYTPHHDSPALGAHVGAQRQFGQFVLGVEGAFVTGFDQATFTATGVPIFTPGGVSNAHAKEKDIWSAGGRAGWAMGTWMPYITAGYANGSSEFDATDSGGGVSMSASTKESGAYIGGGVDWALTNNWIFGVEYRHYDFGKKSVPTLASNGAASTVRFDPSTDTVLARLSYKFDWGKGPVSAKY